jgi:DNA-binding NtrC family response regulator
MHLFQPLQPRTLIRHLLRKDSKNPQLNCFLYGVSPAIRALDGAVHQIAPTDIPVLLIGKPGTGKEDVALKIHCRSRRCKQAFLKFDCQSQARLILRVVIQEGWRMRCK